MRPVHTGEARSQTERIVQHCERTDDRGKDARGGVKDEGVLGSTRYQRDGQSQQASFSWGFHTHLEYNFKIIIIFWLAMHLLKHIVCLKYVNFSPISTGSSRVKAVSKQYYKIII
eukprot:scaffold7615_cov286-Pinguiococcus_pyrenoidosus.AAC.5